MYGFYLFNVLFYLYNPPPPRGCAGSRIGTRFLRPRGTSPLRGVNPAETPGYRNRTESFFGFNGIRSLNGIHHYFKIVVPVGMLWFSIFRYMGDDLPEIIIVDYVQVVPNDMSRWVQRRKGKSHFMFS